MFFDRGYPSFEDVDSAIPIDVVGIKSDMDSLFDPMCVPVGVTFNKLNLAPNRNMPRFVSVLRNRRGLSRSKPYVPVLSVSLRLSRSVRSLLRSRYRPVSIKVFILLW